jgi:hypothetical protein
LAIEGFAMSFEAYAAERPGTITDVDLIVLATGEETDERRINALMWGGPPRLHVWLDPVGIAGHALLGGVPPQDGASDSGVMRGCYECVMLPHATFGFVNRLSLVAPGQHLQRSYAGCAGTFNPFSASAAKRTALEAADLAAAFLAGTVVHARAATWRTLMSSPAPPVTLSRRAQVIAPGSVLHLDATELARDDCPVCATSVSGVALVP